MMQARGAASAVAQLQQRLHSVVAVQEEPGLDERQQGAAAAAAAELLRSGERQQNAALTPTFSASLAQSMDAPFGASEAALPKEAEPRQHAGQQQAAAAAALGQQRDGELSEGQHSRGASKRPWRGPRRRKQQPDGVLHAQQDGAPQAARSPRSNPRRRPAPPQDRKFWRRVPLREQERPDRLVPILLHYTDTCEEVRPRRPGSAGHARVAFAGADDGGGPGGGAGAPAPSRAHPCLHGEGPCLPGGCPAPSQPLRAARAWAGSGRGGVARALRPSLPSHAARCERRTCPGHHPPPALHPQVLELVRMYQSELTPRELTVAFRRMGTMITQALAEPRKPPSLGERRAGATRIARGGPGPGGVAPAPPRFSVARSRCCTGTLLPATSRAPPPAAAPSSRQPRGQQPRGMRAAVQHRAGAAARHGRPGAGHRCLVLLTLPLRAAAGKWDAAQRPPGRAWTAPAQPACGGACSEGAALRGGVEKGAGSGKGGVPRCR